MRARAGIGMIAALGLWSCHFEGFADSYPDAIPDTAIDAIDASPDDGPASLRATTGLIGLWTFGDPTTPGYVDDTANQVMPVPLQIVTNATTAAPTISGGVATATLPARLISKPTPHLAGDCQAGGGVTLEVWLTPGNPTQGGPTNPTFVAGLASSVSLRDVALTQVGDHWVARVRTTAALDGTPDLRASASVDTTTMTHVVVVADATQRTLFIDGVADAVGTPGKPLSWDINDAMAIFDEPQHARQWVGSIALVALYDRGLSAAEVQQNFQAGPDVP